MRSHFVALAAILAAALARPQQAPAAPPIDNDVRGGWIADVNGQRLIYVLKIRDGRISGIFCPDCADPDQVAFLADGRFETNGIAFRVLHVAGPGAPYAEETKGRLENGRLILTSTRAGTAHRPARQRNPRRLLHPGRRAPSADAVAAHMCRQGRTSR